MAVAPSFPVTLPADGRLSRWRASDGWDHRRFDWPSDGGRGQVLVQGGRADVVEKYLGAMAHLHDRGWSVASFDWRGQGGSGRLGRDPAIGHVDRFDTQIGDLAAFWAEWEGERPRAIVAHSMGGYLALAAVLAGRIRPDALVLAAPMIRIRSPLGQRFGGWLARTMVRRGEPSRRAWRSTGSPQEQARRLARLTVTRGEEQDGRWWEADPQLALGPPSWGWVAEAFRVGGTLERDPRVAACTVPTLFLIPDHDRLVDAAAARRVAARMPVAEMVGFGPEAGHEVLREGPAVRDRAFAAIDDFLDRKAPRR